MVRGISRVGGFVGGEVEWGGFRGVWVWVKTDWRDGKILLSILICCVRRMGKLSCWGTFWFFPCSRWDRSAEERGGYA